MAGELIIAKKPPGPADEAMLGSNHTSTNQR